MRKKNKKNIERNNKKTKIQILHSINVNEIKLIKFVKLGNDEIKNKDNNVYSE